MSDYQKEFVVTMLYWPFSLFCLVRWTDSSNSSVRFTMPMMLSGHYVQWPSRKMEEKYVDENRFIPRNVIYTRFQLCFEHVFLVAPRFKPGVPFTLGSMAITDEKKCCNYVQPYPCMHKQNTNIGTCATETLINAVDLVLGEDGVLWVLDIGLSETFSDRPSKDGDAKIIGYDAATGKTKHLISLRSLTYRSQSRLQYLMVEYVKKSMTMLYVGDGGTRSIIVWNVQSNEGCRIKLPHTISLGCVENPLDDVFYIAMVEQQTGNYVYFTYLSGEDIYRTKTNYLKKRMNPKCIVNIGKKPYKMIFVGVGYGSILYFRIKDQNDLYSWDTKHSCLEENFMVVLRSKDCRTVTHVDVDTDGALWVMESNLKDFVNDRLGSLGPSMLLTPVFEAPTAISDGLETNGDG